MRRCISVEDRNYGRCGSVVWNMDEDRMMDEDGKMDEDRKMDEDG